MKAVGAGIGHDLQSVEFRLGTGELRQEVRNPSVFLPCHTRIYSYVSMVEYCAVEKRIALGEVALL